MIRLILRNIIEYLAEIMGFKIIKLNVKQKNNYYKHHQSRQIANISEIQEIFLGKKTNGIFIEVGAYDGISFGSTIGLAKKGWSGLMIEPEPRNFRKLCRNMKKYNNVELWNIAISDKRGMVTVDSAGPLSSLSNFTSRSKSCTQTMTLNELLNEQSIPINFDYLSVDTEGWESQVLDGFNISLYQPKMMCIELKDTSRNDSESLVIGQKLYIEIIKDLKYVVVYKDWINTVFVRNDIYLENQKKNAEFNR